MLSNAMPLETEKVSLFDANQRVLAENVYYDQSLPPYDKSAMDGFACRMEDIRNELTIVETIMAGHPAIKSIGPNECARIMTGAVVPEGADCVFIKEHSELREEDKVICTSVMTQTNICIKGEDVKAGDLAIASQTLITPKTIPLLAGAGIHQVPVYKQPSITVFSTGTELVEPEQLPLPYQIRNSNSFQIISLLQEMGIKARYGGIIRDDREETVASIQEAIRQSDIVILSGGVSMGDSDFIPDVLEEINLKILLTQSAVQPGKPILFAQGESRYCFGLAGNPVSSYIQTELYVKPFLFAMMNHRIAMIVLSATLQNNFNRKNSDRLKFIPGWLNENNEVEIIEFHGSAHIAALQHANCLVEIPIGVEEVLKGDKINVRPI